MVSSRGQHNENLRPVRTKGEARERGRAGGIASARKRQERKSWKETAEIVLKLALEDGPIDSIAGVESIKDAKKKNLTVQDHIIIALAGKASKGEVKATELLKEILGEQPAQSSVSPLEKLAESIDRYKDDEDDDRDTSIRG